MMDADKEIYILCADDGDIVAEVACIGWLLPGIQIYFKGYSIGFRTDKCIDRVLHSIVSSWYDVWSPYQESRMKFAFVALRCGLLRVNFAHVFQGYFTVTS